jgi:hypothetical protein
MMVSRDSSVGIEPGYRLEGQGSIASRDKFFFSLRPIWPASLWLMWLFPPEACWPGSAVDLSN